MISKCRMFFFQDLKIPAPDIYLGAKSGSHAFQTADVLTAFEKVLLSEKPSLVLVVGDVNSTIACTLAAAKLGIRVAHVEAGLRSFDRRMPEEINRIVTDRLADYLFVTEVSGVRNLKKEGIDSKKVFLVGNVMIDTLLANLPAIQKSRALEKHGLRRREYAVLTLHRPSNVDSKASLLKIAGILEKISKQTPLVFPIHPRTLSQIRRFGLQKRFQGMKNLRQIEPLGYIDFIRLVQDSLFVLTDSGGIQEEAVILRVPCLTMRENTERPATVDAGSNQLVGQNEKKILSAVRKIIKGKVPKVSVPRFWDGKTAIKIARQICFVL